MTRKKKSSTPLRRTSRARKSTPKKKRTPARKKSTAYGKSARRKVARALHEEKLETLKSGRSGKKVTSRKQAIAIGLSEARARGGKVPEKKR